MEKFYDYCFDYNNTESLHKRRSSDSLIIGISPLMVCINTISMQLIFYNFFYQPIENYSNIRVICSEFNYILDIIKNYWNERFNNDLRIKNITSFFEEKKFFLVCRIT